MSSALQIATAKCAHRSYCLSEGGYKLPQCSRWIQSILSLPPPFSVCLILSLFLRPVCIWYDLPAYPPIIMLFESLSLQRGGIKALLSTGSRRARVARRVAPVDSISTEVGINIFRPIQIMQGWCGVLLQITLCPINSHKDGDKIIHTQRLEVTTMTLRVQTAVKVCEYICLALLAQKKKKKKHRWFTGIILLYPDTSSSASLWVFLSPFTCVSAISCRPSLYRTSVTQSHEWW